MFSGSIVALITPFTPDGEVDYISLKSWSISMLMQEPMRLFPLAPPLNPRR